MSGPDGLAQPVQAGAGGEAEGHGPVGRIAKGNRREIAREQISGARDHALQDGVEIERAVQVARQSRQDLGVLAPSSRVLVQRGVVQGERRQAREALQRVGILLQERVRFGPASTHDDDPQQLVAHQERLGDRVTKALGDGPGNGPRPARIVVHENSPPRLRAPAGHPLAHRDPLRHHCGVGVDPRKQPRAVGDQMDAAFTLEESLCSRHHDPEQVVRIQLGDQLSLDVGERLDLPPARPLELKQAGIVEPLLRQVGIGRGAAAVHGNGSPSMRPV